MNMKLAIFFVKVDLNKKGSISLSSFFNEICPDGKSCQT